METNDKTSCDSGERPQLRLSGSHAPHAPSRNGRRVLRKPSGDLRRTMTPDSFLNWLLSREWDYRVARNIERLVKAGVQFYVPKLTRIIESLGAQSHPIQR